AANIRDAAGDQTEAQLEQNEEGQHGGTKQEQQAPAALPSRAECHERLEKRQHHGQQAELDGVRVRRDLHGFLGLQLAVIIEGRVQGGGLVRCGCGAHLRQVAEVTSFMLVKIEGGIAGTAEKTKDDEEEPASEQQ